MYTDQEISPGTRLLDRFEILEAIGRGGMGQVYKAIDHDIGDEIVALKVLQPQYLNDAGMFTRFRKEVAIARGLTHTGIVRTHDLFRTKDGISFISMEFVSGRSLKCLRRCAGENIVSAVSRVLDPFEQLLDAVSYAHSRGVIHRDLKPANILLTDSGGIKIADFGTARVLSESTGITETGFVIGTPDYMSPEHIKGGVIDERSDIYSLAVLLYELLAGSRPFSAPTSVGVAYMQVHEAFPKLSMHPELITMLDYETLDNLDGVLECASAKDSANRYVSIAAFKKEVCKALVRIIEFEPESSSRMSTGRPESGRSFDNKDEPSHSDSWRLNDGDIQNGAIKLSRKKLVQPRNNLKKLDKVTLQEESPLVKLFKALLKYAAFTIVFGLAFLWVFSPGFVSYVKDALSISTPDKSNTDVTIFPPANTDPTKNIDRVRGPSVPQIISEPVNQVEISSSPLTLQTPTETASISLESFTVFDNIEANGLKLESPGQVVPSGFIKWEAIWRVRTQYSTSLKAWVNVFSPSDKKILIRSDPSTPEKVAGIASENFTLKASGEIGSFSIGEEAQLIRVDLILGGELQKSVIVPVRRPSREAEVIATISPVLISQPIISASPSPVNNGVDVIEQPMVQVSSNNIEISGMIDIIPPFSLGKVPQHFKITVTESDNRSLSGEGSIEGVATYSVTGRRYENSIKLVLRSRNRPDGDEVLTLIGEKKTSTSYAGSYQSSRTPDPGFWKGSFIVK